MFCSDECAEAAAVYHQWECGDIAALSQGWSIRYRAAAVRVLTQAPWQDISENADSIRSALVKEHTSSVEKDIWDTKSLLGFLSHMSNNNDADRWDLYCKMLTCMYLVKFLEKSGHFKGNLITHAGDYSNYDLVISQHL